MKKLVLAAVLLANVFLAGCVQQNTQSRLDRVASLKSGMTVAQVHSHIPAKDRMGIRINYRKHPHLVEYVSLERDPNHHSQQDNLYLLIYHGYKHPRLQSWGFARNLLRDKDRQIRTVARKASREANVLHRGIDRELAQFITQRRANYLGTETVEVQGQNIDVDYFRERKTNNIYLITYNYQGKVLAFGHPSDFRKSKQSFKVALGREAIAIYKRT